MIPADVRILTCRDLFITQASLTGESLPVEKFDDGRRDGRPDRARAQEPLLPRHGGGERHGHRRSSSRPGPRTYLGTIASTLTGEPVADELRSRAWRSFTWLMIRFIVVMVPLVFVINGLTKHDWKEAFFFALAVAVGPHARDAAHDRVGLPLARRARHVAARR